jgi:hypothetical protein
MKTAIATGPSTASVANSLAASGMIMDIPGNLNLVLLKLQEAGVLLNMILTNDIDTNDGIKTGLTTVNNVLKWPMASVPISLPYPTVLFDKLDEFLLEFSEQDQEVQAGVASDGEAAAYALVWEWGNMRQKFIGPKTTLGLNPDGQRVWLSIQAPTGWIRVNEAQYWQFFEEEMAKAKFSSPSTGDISDELRGIARRAAKRICELMKDTVPVDSGDLRDSLEVVDPEDYAALDLGADTSDWDTLVLTDVSGE